jgi:hypothetical protein
MGGQVGADNTDDGGAGFLTAKYAKYANAENRGSKARIPSPGGARGGFLAQIRPKAHFGHLFKINPSQRLFFRGAKTWVSTRVHGAWD